MRNAEKRDCVGPLSSGSGERKQIIMGKGAEAGENGVRGNAIASNITDIKKLPPSFRECSTEARYLFAKRGPKRLLQMIVCWSKQCRKMGTHLGRGKRAFGHGKRLL